MKERDAGVSTVLGTVLMLSLMLMLIPGALMMKGAIADEMEAERASAQHAAYCARNPGIGPPTCDAPGPMPGYACTQVSGSQAWLCAPANATNVTPPVTTPSVSTTPTVTSPTLHL